MLTSIQNKNPISTIVLVQECMFVDSGFIIEKITFSELEDWNLTRWNGRLFHMTREVMRDELQNCRYTVGNPYAAYWHTGVNCILSVLNAACVHILVANKHISVYIIISTDCQLLHHILSVRIYTSAIWRSDIKLMFTLLKWKCTAQIVNVSSTNP